METSLLTSEDHTHLLDTIDNLRSQGLSHHVSLPQLIVCGDQSAGKSSVLEAVSGVRFPTKDGLCTRFATELVLRRSSAEYAAVKIIPSSNTSDAEKERLSNFRVNNVKFADIPQIIEDAKEAMNLNMGASQESRAFSEDVLHIEVSGPNQPHLTLVDLPGVIQTASKGLTEADVKLVRDMVLKYMTQQRSIILAVVSARYDFSNQIVTGFARSVDPQGRRTLGIITKPDAPETGSELESDYIRLANNEEIPFKLGWHVLKNRDYYMRDCSAEERDRSERVFFSSETWSQLPSNCLGIDALRPRLSRVLMNQIILELPNLIREVNLGIESCRATLSSLGQARRTIEEQRLYLITLSQSCSSLIKGAVDGNYADAFFTMGDGTSTRFRAAIQYHLSEFEKAMRTRGQRVEIIDDGGQANEEDGQISRKKFVEQVRREFTVNKGRELPGLFNPLVVGDLFYKQAQPWKDVADEYRQTFCIFVERFLESILTHLTDEKTRDGLNRYIFKPAMETYASNLQKKIEEVLKPHQRGHPITYNKQFSRELQTIRKRNAKRDITTKLCRFFSLSEPESSRERWGVLTERDVDLDGLLDQLTPANEKDTESSACSEAVDCMKAYYKVALQVFIDNFATLAVEGCLMEKLPTTFTPERVLDLPETVIEEIAAEPEGSKITRAVTMSKLESLEKGSKTLQSLSRHEISDAFLRGQSSVEGPRDAHRSSATEDATNEVSAETAQTPLDDNHVSSGDSASPKENDTAEPAAENDPTASDSEPEGAGWASPPQEAAARPRTPDQGGSSRLQVPRARKTPLSNSQRRSQRRSQSRSPSASSRDASPAFVDTPASSVASRDGESYTETPSKVRGSSSGLFGTQRGSPSRDLRATCEDTPDGPS